MDTISSGFFLKTILPCMQNKHISEFVDIETKWNFENMMKKGLSKVLSRNVTCTTGKSGRDTCSGDSGGPLVTIKKVICNL